MLPAKAVRTKSPWISDQTLRAIESRQQARRRGAHDELKELSSRIKPYVKRDREVWLRDLAGCGDWKKPKQLRKGTARCQGQLNDESGTSVWSKGRAETFAAYLEDVQWAERRSAKVVARPYLRAQIDIDTGSYNNNELIY